MRAERVEAPRQSVLLADVPFHAQAAYQCGPAALASVLNHAGVPVAPEALVGEVWIPGRRGSLQLEMLAAVRRHGRLGYRLPGDPAALEFQNLGWAWWPVWHYAVLIGIDAERGQAILHSGTEAALRVPWPRFLRSWERGGRWAMTVLRPEAVPADAEAEAWLDAAAALESAGALDEALRAHAAATRRWPQQARAWLAYGNLAHARGDRYAALRALQRAAELAPEDAAVLNNLAFVLAEFGCREQAQARIERAAALAGSRWAAQIARTAEEIQHMPAGACPLEP